MVWHFSTRVSDQPLDQRAARRRRAGAARLAAHLTALSTAACRDGSCSSRYRATRSSETRPHSGNDEEARGQGEQGHVGEEAEARDRPGLVAEVVHRVGGHGEGERAPAASTMAAPRSATFSRQRRRTPRMTLP